MKDRDFDALIDSIQQELFSEARLALGNRGFERWRNPRYCGAMSDADSIALLKGSCGDHMEMFIKVKNRTIADASYLTDGCGSSSVAGSFTVELGIGKSFEEVMQLTGADVLAKIGTFPKAEEHCAYLAVKTLQKAVRMYLRHSDELDHSTK